MADVGCAGILVADMLCGPMAELPKEGQLLAVDAMPSKSGGCAGNAAVGLAKQGLAVDVVGCLGKDAAAKIVLSSLEDCGVNCEQVTCCDGYPTSQTVILLVEGHDRRYIHCFGANRAFSCEHISSSWLSGLKAFYLGGFFAMPSVKGEQLREVLDTCRKNGVTTIVDVVIPQTLSGFGELEPLLPLIDFFVPSDDEAAQITGQSDPVDQVRAIQERGAKTVVITQGKKGAIAASGKDLWRSASYKVDVIDPSGSGDAFTGGLIAAALRGWEMPRVLAYAAALGASATRAIGCTDGVFSAQEAEAFLEAHTLPIEHTLL